MSREYIKNQIQKIMNDESFEYPKNVAYSCAWILAHFKGTNLKVFDVSKSSSLADYYVLVSSSNTTMSKSMVEEIGRQMKSQKLSTSSAEGLEDGEWILLDLGDVIIHIFLDYARMAFDLDDLWSEYPKLEIPEEYYFPEPEEQTQDSDDSDQTDKYF